MLVLQTKENQRNMIDFEGSRSKKNHWNMNRDMDIGFENLEFQNEKSNVFHFSTTNPLESFTMK